MDLQYQDKMNGCYSGPDEVEDKLKLFSLQSQYYNNSLNNISKLQEQIQINGLSYQFSITLVTQFKWLEAMIS
jgi:hypothetical protein